MGRGVEGSASHREVLDLAAPNVLSNLTVPLLGIVDTAVVGRLEGLGPLGAVALGATGFQMLYWGFGFLRMGTTGLVAQAFGAGDDAEGERVLARGLAVALGAAALMLLGQWPLRELMFRLLEAPPEVAGDARAYFDVRIWAAPFTLASYALHGFFLGRQDARTPLAMASVSNLVNAALDWWLAGVLGWGASGIAAGTVVGQVLGCAVGLVGLRRATGRWWPAVPWDALVDPEAVARMAGISRDITLRTASMLAVLAYFMARSAAAGPEVLAVNSVLMNLWNLHAYFVDGFAFAAESLVGRALGAGDPGGLRGTVRKLMAWGVGVSGLVSLGYFLGRDLVLAVFTDKPAVLAGCREVFAWTLLAPWINAVAFLWDGVFLGATASRALRDAMLGCGVLVFLPAAWWLEGWRGPHGLWAALTAWELSRGVALTAMVEGAVYARLEARASPGPSAAGSG